MIFAVGRAAWGLRTLATGLCKRSADSASVGVPLTGRGAGIVATGGRGDDGLMAEPAGNWARVRGCCVAAPDPVPPHGVSCGFQPKGKPMSSGTATDDDGGKSF